MIDSLFFELIQVSVGVRNTLSVMPDELQWNELFQLARKHALIGVCVTGIEHLHLPSSRIHTPLFLIWIGLAESIKDRNNHMTALCADLNERFKNVGYRSCIIKGQGLQTLYPEDLSFRRQCGDIDIWVDGDRDEVIDRIRSMGIEVSDVDSVHSHVFFYPGVEVELHSRPGWMYWYKGDVVFADFCRREGNGQFDHFNSELGFCHPTVRFNLVFSLLHMYRHIFLEGLGLRQVMDYYFILKASTESDRASSLPVLRKMKMLRFASGIMYIEQKVFGMSSEYFLVPQDRSEGEFLLEDILKGGNFGTYDANYHPTRSKNLCERGWIHLSHSFRYLIHYPLEVLSLPFWKIWHHLWRKKKRYL